MYKTILVTTDFVHKEQTIAALQKARKLTDNGCILLLHVVDDIPVYALGEIPENIIVNIAADQVKKAFTELKAIADKAAVAVQVEVRQGRAYSNIIDAAKEHHADLILINSHRPGFSDYLLGSTASKVVRHAQCSVLVVR